MRFHDWNVIVTGGTRGIGRALSQAFLKEGARVIATYSGNDREAQSFAESMASFGEKLVLRKFNVANAEEVRAFYQDFEVRFDRLDVLVNNAGIKRDQVTALLSDEDWRQVLAVNLDGSFYMARAAVPLMMKNRFGRIINMSSIGGKIGLPGQANYAASKAGQIAMVKVLAKEAGRKGITVNAVCPGFIETEMVGSLSEEQKRGALSDIPVRRFGSAEEVAHAVTFLASKEASYITGASLDISGGLGL